MLRIIKSTWIRTLVALDVRDPLKLTDAPYLLPADLRASGECKIEGYNHKHPIEDIARAYEMTPNQVVSILISEGLIKEQRRNTIETVKGGRRFDSDEPIRYLLEVTRVKEWNQFQCVWIPNDLLLGMRGRCRVMLECVVVK